jgi:hypothetical protein
MKDAETKVGRVSTRRTRLVHLSDLFLALALALALRMTLGVDVDLARLPFRSVLWFPPDSR